MFSTSPSDREKKIFWQEMWRHEFEEAVKHDPVVIVPTGSVEQHGPHSPMDVDVVGPLHIAIKTANQINDFPVIVTPPVWSGFAHYNLGFAGTISLGMDTYRNLVLDICRSIYANGFRRIVLLNGHGGNHAPNATIKHQLSQENIFILTFSWWELVKDEMAKLSSSDGSDVGHGGEWETSVQLYLRPHLIAKDRMVPDPRSHKPILPQGPRIHGRLGSFCGEKEGHGKRKRNDGKSTRC